MYLPEQFAEMAALEKEFNKSIHFKSKKRNGEVEIEHLWMGDRADAGTPFAGITPELIAELRDTDWDYPIFNARWEMPLGAIANQNGPS